MNDLYLGLTLAAPELILAIGIMFVLIFGAVRGDEGAGAVSLLCGALLMAAAAVAAFGPDGEAFSGSFTVDTMARFAKTVMALAGLVVIILAQGHFDRMKSMRFEFPILVLLAILGMYMMVSAGDLIALYIGLELQSLSLYVLASIARNDEKSSEAGLKYFVLGALSSGLLLYGISLIYGFTGAMNFEAIRASIDVSSHNIGLTFGLVFLISGLAFKVSAAPFHMWTPDVYEGAPTPVVAFFAGAPKMAAMILLVRVLETAFGGITQQWQQVLLALAVLSFIVGGLGGLKQTNIKRLLAYSSIINMGYVLLALAVSSALGVSAILVFFLIYVVDTLGLFAAQLALQKDQKSIENISDVSGLAKSDMPMAIVITVLVLSMLGMPPMGGFWGKFMVFGAALSGSAWLWPYAAAGLVASVVAGFYYLRILKLIWFDAPQVQFDSSPSEARLVAIILAIIAFPVMMVALSLIYPVAERAGALFGNAL
jgi:NADH-quinone oxidoreductase subunit N